MRKTFLAVAGGACAVLLAGCGGAPGERDYQAGVREYERGNYTRAMSHFEKAVHAPSGAAPAAAWNYLGCAAWHLRQLPAARTAFETCLRVAPACSAAQYNLAALQAAGGNASAAIAQLLPVAARETARSEPLELLGQIYLDRQAWPEARRVLLEAAQRAPQAPRVLTRLALAELGAGDERSAVALLNRALDRDGQYAPALFNLALLYHQRHGDKIQAGALLRRFLAAAPEDEHAGQARQLLADFGGAVPPVTPVAPTSGVRLLNRPAPLPAPARGEAGAGRTVEAIVKEAGAEVERGHTPRAAILFLEAASRAEREQNAAAQEQVLTQAARACFDQARIHAALGQFQFDHGRTEAALKSFKQALVLDGKFVPAHLGLAAAAGRTGEYDAALVALKTAVQIDPQNADAQWQLAQLFDLALKSADRAAASYRQFIKQFPGDPRVLKAQERLGALGLEGVRKPATPPATPPAKEPARGKKPPQAAAEETPPAPIAANPQAAVQAYNRARQYQAQQDWESAISYYKSAIQNNPAMANAWFNLGLVFAAKSDNVGARDAYEHAIRTQPDMAAARYNLALLLLGARKRDEALVQLRELVRLQPDNAAASYVLGYVLADDPLATQQAKQAYTRFLELAPSDPNAAGVRDWLKRH
jgi:tetratricopeptide (TPR) repeat protein